MNQYACIFAYQLIKRQHTFYGIAPARVYWFCIGFYVVAPLTWHQIGCMNCFYFQSINMHAELLHRIGTGQVVLLLINKYSAERPAQFLHEMH